MSRATIICIGPADQRFHSRLFNLFYQQRLHPLSFVSVGLEQKVWAKFQVEGSCSHIVRLKAKILSLNDVELCLELKSSVLTPVPKAVASGLSSLGIALNRQPDGRTFRGFQ